VKWSGEDLCMVRTWFRMFKCLLLCDKDGMRGRRVLQFGNTNATLLKGKSIYLDLHGYKRAGYIESGLKERGAVS